MIALYGAGNEFVELVERGATKEVSNVIDSDTAKIGQIIEGYTVEGNEVLNNYTAEDCVCITSYRYFSEIESAIRRINQVVPISDKLGFLWRIEKKALKAQMCIEKEDYYVSVAKEAIDIWVDNALITEVGYWGGAIPQNINNNKKLLEKDREFKHNHFPDIVISENSAILDVGCGPLPRYGDMVNGKKLNYIPADPLAYHYKRLLDKNNAVLPIEISFTIMEALSSFYGENSIDYCIVDNALDHSIDILRAFIECFRVIKMGGRLLLTHMDSEGLNEDYWGLHKWNISSTECDLVFFNEEMKINVSNLFRDYADIKIQRKKRHERDIIIADVYKKADVSSSIIERYDSPIYVGYLIDRLFYRMVN